METYRYIVVQTDTHVVEPGRTLYGLDTERRVRSCVTGMAREPVPVDLMVHLGDVCDTVLNPDRVTAVGSPSSYEHAVALFSEFTATKLYIPGNHDDPTLMYEMLGDKWTSREAGVLTRKLGDVVLVGLDMRTGPEPTAYLASETAEKLRAVLAATERCILFSHYPFTTYDNERIGRDLRVLNDGALLSLLKEFQSRILAYFHGHLHLWASYSVGGIPVFALPGSSFNFRLEPADPEWERTIPGPLGHYLVGIGSEGNVVVRPRFTIFE